jgi:hypothetical protein
MLVLPNRLACFLLCLFSRYSDIPELPFIHLHQLSPLPVALTAQSAGNSETMEGLWKRNWRPSSIFPKQVTARRGQGFGDLASFIRFQGMPGQRIRLFLSLHNYSHSLVVLNTGEEPQPSWSQANIHAENIAVVFSKRR